MSGLAATLFPLRDKTATYPVEYGKRAGELIARGARSLHPTLRQKKRNTAFELAPPTEPNSP